MPRRPDRKWLAHLAVFAAAFAAALWMWIEVSLAPQPPSQWVVEDEPRAPVPGTIAISDSRP